MNIETIYPTGNTLYVLIQDPETGNVWNTGTNLFETYNGSHWANYAIPMAERTNTGYYAAVYPTAITIRTSEILYLQAGGGPALGDTPITVGSSQGDNVNAIGGSVIAASNAGKAAASEVQGAATSSILSTTQMSTDLVNTLAAAYVGRTLIWTSGVLAGVAAAVTGYIPTNGVLTFTQVPSAPSAADKFIII